MDKGLMEENGTYCALGVLFNEGLVNIGKANYFLKVQVNYMD